MPIVNSASVPGSGIAEPVENCPVKEVVTVSPAWTDASNCWKVWSVNGVVNAPVIGIVVPVALSTSTPRILNEAAEAVADVSARLNGDRLGTFGVHISPAAATAAEQPADPSIPGIRNVKVMEILGAAAKVI